MVLGGGGAHLRAGWGLQIVKRRAMGSHQSARPKSLIWLTPPAIIEALGPFDLDPCAAPEPRPWPTASRMISKADGDGLALDWDGRVFMNPPYAGQARRWLRKLADHGRGTALIFARTETEAFEQEVWGRASGLLFIFGRLHFHYPDGRRADHNGGAPSVLCAYGVEDMERLAAARIRGNFVPLRFARFTLIAGLDRSWAQLVREWIARERGPVSVSDAYRHFARHPKAKRNPNWRAKVRQKLMIVGERIAPATYALRPPQGERHAQES